MRDKLIVKAKRPVHTGHEPGVVWRNPLFVSVQWVLTGGEVRLPNEFIKKYIWFCNLFKVRVLETKDDYLREAW